MEIVKLILYTVNMIDEGDALHRSLIDSKWCFSFLDSGQAYTARMTLLNARFQWIEEE